MPRNCTLVRRLRYASTAGLSGSEIASGLLSRPDTLGTVASTGHVGAEPGEIVGVADRVVEVIDRGTPRRDPAADRRPTASIAVRTGVGLIGSIGCHGGAHELGIAGRQRRVDLQLIDALFEQCLLIDESATIGLRAGVVVGAARIDLGVERRRSASAGR